MRIIFFESQDVENLHPVTLSRAGFDILCGGTTLYNLLQRAFPLASISWQARNYLTAVTQLRHPRQESESADCLYVNALLAPSTAVLRALQDLTEQKNEVLITSGNEVLAAYLRQPLSGVDANSDFATAEMLQSLDISKINIELPYLNKLWEIIFANEKHIGENIDFLSQFFAKQSGQVYYGNNVSVASNVVFDTANGAVILDDDVKIAEFCVLRGPLYVGKKTIIRAFCELKDGTSIGSVCKIGGEVEAAIIQGYANKQHYGFLGHSYVGEWVNLGAGTSNSDLKNTYGEIKMKGEKTGRQFLGCVIADYAKAAVGSAIYTGKVIGFNSCIYGITAHDVPSFTNYARFGEKQVLYPLHLALKSQAAMFQRRNADPVPENADLLTEIFHMTEKERQVGNVTEGSFVL